MNSAGSALPGLTPQLLHEAYRRQFAEFGEAFGGNSEETRTAIQFCHTDIFKYSFNKDSLIVNAMNCIKPLERDKINRKWKLIQSQNAPTFTQSLEHVSHAERISEYQRDEIGYYTLFDFGIPWFKPAKTYTNALAVFYHKSSKKVPSTGRDQWESFRENCGTRYLVRILLEETTPLSREEIYTKSVAHIENSSKKALYTRFLDKNDWESLCNPGSIKSGQLTLTLQVKFDEVLAKRVPRPINNQTLPVTVATMGVAPAAEKIKGVFNGSPRFIECYGTTFKLFLYFAPGGIVDTLSDVCNAFRNTVGPAIMLMVSGDDSYMEINWPDRGLMFYEGDLSSCDLTVREGALETEYDMLHAVGLPEDVIDLLRRCSQSFMAHYGKTHSFKCVHKNPCTSEFPSGVRQTGGSDTSIGNTCVVAAAWLSVLFLNIPENRWVASFEEYGFKLKLDSHPISPFQPYSGTFLKGRFMETEKGYVWTPLLPSGFFKRVSKTLKDPCRIVSSRRCREKDMRKAALKYLRQVTAGLNSVPLCWFNQEIRARLPSASDSQPRFNYMGWCFEAPSVYDETYVGSREESLGYLQWRYGVSVDDVDSFFELLGEELEVFTGYIHPLSWILVVNDYY